MIKFNLQRVMMFGFTLPQTIRQALYIGIPLLVLTLLIFFWAYFVRKRQRRHRKYHHHHHKHGGEEAATEHEVEAEPALTPEPVNRRRHRARRSKYPPRPLNPTLAQTRGLPPMRDESTPPAGL